MNQGTKQLLFALLRSAICGNELTDSEKASLSGDTIRDVFKIAKHHDLGHLISYALEKNSISADNSENGIFKAVLRYKQLSHEYEVLCEALEGAGIDFIPLKGSVIRKYYPERWMRTSCDIDILVHDEDTERAVKLLTHEHEYTYHGKGSHDISLFSAGGIHVELHYNLVEDGIANESSSVLSSVWYCTTLRQGFGHCYDMNDEMFYFYHIAHMAKHFENGGCGIRPFIDLWILDNIKDADISARDNLLERGGLLRFANAARKLSRIWFKDEKKDNVSLKMENYILYGGVYGNNENRVTVQQQKKGGKLKYAMSRIFIPYDEIKFHYPVLQKHKWLTPFMEVRRWFKLIFCGGMKRSVNELKYNSSISSDKADDMQKLLSDIGLSN